MINPRANEFAHCDYMEPFPETCLAMRNTLRNATIDSITTVGDVVLDLQDKFVLVEQHVKDALHRRRRNAISLGKITASTAVFSTVLGIASATAAHAGEVVGVMEQVVGHQTRTSVPKDRTGTTAVIDAEAVNHRFNLAHSAQVLTTDGIHDGKVVEFVDKCPDVYGVQTISDADVSQAVHTVKSSLGAKQISIAYGCKGPSPWAPIRLSNPSAQPVNF